MPASNNCRRCGIFLLSVETNGGVCGLTETANCAQRARGEPSGPDYKRLLVLYIAGVIAEEDDDYIEMIRCNRLIASKNEDFDELYQLAETARQYLTEKGWS